MNKQIRAIQNDMNQIAEDAGALLGATADVAGEHVAQARVRLAAALERGRSFYGEVRSKAAGAMHENPYPTVGIGMGLGALVGFLVARKFAWNRD